MGSRRCPQAGFWIALTMAAVMTGLSSCGSDKGQEQKATAPGVSSISGGDAAISGTITLDPPLKEKIGKTPLLMIIASSSPEPSKPAVIVKRVADAAFPYDYKLTAEDITLVGSTFEGKVYVSARIDPAGMVGPPRPGAFEGLYPGNPVAVGSSKVDIVINKAY